MAASVESCAEIKLSLADDEDKRVKLIQRAQWLRAAILGANDGLLSTTSLMLGVGAAKEDQGFMIISGVAGALAGACSMAVGEFVSVSTQRDIEQTTIDKFNAEAELSVKKHADSVKPQESMPVEGDLAISSPLAASSKIPCKNMNGYVESSRQKVSPATLLRQSSPHIFSPPRSPFMKVVARDTRASPLQDSRLDDNTEEMLPNPYKAAGASGLAFLCGSLVPLLSAMVFSQYKIRVVAIVIVTSIALAIFGGAGARLGRSPVKISAMRVLLGGWISMAVTYGLLKPLDRDHKGHETD
ncbi:hypothetical protein Pfo_018936 [Paulownia fortunei]|nr:hypothetical protein Pfo_018936 [Paulownia fortunei]